jgi:membrane-associated phospholipid phosphatase
MMALHEWELPAVRFLQGAASPLLTALMIGVSALGSPLFYFAAVPLLYWCVDEKRGARLGIVFIVSAFSNMLLKDAIGADRPYLLDPALALAFEDSKGFPSAHAQLAASFWPLVAIWLRKPWGIALALAPPLLIGVSRVYLGVHYPSDILGGWVIGAAIAGGYLLIEPRLKLLLRAKGFRVQALVVAGVAIAMNALHPDDPRLSGAFLGLGLGYALKRRFAPAPAAASIGAKAAALALGYAGAGIAYGLYALAANAAPPDLERIARFAGYGIMGLWVGLGPSWALGKIAARQGTV